MKRQPIFSWALIRQAIHRATPSVTPHTIHTDNSKSHSVIS